MEKEVEKEVEAQAEKQEQEQEPAAAEAPVAARNGDNQRKGAQLGALSQLETDLSEGMMTTNPRAEAERSRLLEIVREARRRDGERLPTEQPRHMQLEAAVELASSRLEAMSYQALLAERGAWLRLPVAALPPPDVGKGDKQRGWRLAWPPQLEALLRDRPVRKRFGAHGTWLGRVVGSFEAFFQVLYEDGDSEEARPVVFYYSLLTPHYSPLTAHCSLLTAHCSLLTTHCSLLTAHCSLLTAHCSLLTAHYYTCTCSGTARADTARAPSSVYPSSMSYAAASASAAYSSSTRGTDTTGSARCSSISAMSSSPLTSRRSCPSQSNVQTRSSR